MWDDPSVMHQANPDYDMNERRFLYRLMLKGEVPAMNLRTIIVGAVIIVISFLGANPLLNRLWPATPPLQRAGRRSSRCRRCRR